MKKQTFKQFLIQEGIYENYKKNFYHKQGKGYTKARIMLAKHMCTTTFTDGVLDFIPISFNWYETPEGHQTWRDIRNKWFNH